MAAGWRGVLPQPSWPARCSTCWVRRARRAGLSRKKRRPQQTRHAQHPQWAPCRLVRTASSSSSMHGVTRCAARCAPLWSAASPSSCSQAPPPDTQPPACSSPAPSCESPSLPTSPSPPLIRSPSRPQQGACLAIRGEPKRGPQQAQHPLQTLWHICWWRRPRSPRRCSVWRLPGATSTSFCALSLVAATASQAAARWQQLEGQQRPPQPSAHPLVLQRSAASVTHTHGHCKEGVAGVGQQQRQQKGVVRAQCTGSNQELSRHQQQQQEGRRCQREAVGRGLIQQTQRGAPPTRAPPFLVLGREESSGGSPEVCPGTLSL